MTQITIDTVEHVLAQEAADMEIEERLWCECPQTPECYRAMALTDTLYKTMRRLKKRRALVAEAVDELREGIETKGFYPLPPCDDLRKKTKECLFMSIVFGVHKSLGLRLVHSQQGQYLQKT